MYVKVITVKNGIVLVRTPAFYIDLINKAAFDLDDMFKKTYGELYMQESHIFSDLFRQLQLYYSSGRDLDIIKVFDKFFKILMQKMFSLLNAQYSFSSKFARLRLIV